MSASITGHLVPTHFCNLLGGSDYTGGYRDNSRACGVAVKLPNECRRITAFARSGRQIFHESVQPDHMAQYTVHNPNHICELFLVSVSTSSGALCSPTTEMMQ